MHISNGKSQHLVDCLARQESSRAALHSRRGTVKLYPHQQVCPLSVVENDKRVAVPPFFSQVTAIKLDEK